jgi:hypothetical protein
MRRREGDEQPPRSGIEGDGRAIVERLRAKAEHCLGRTSGIPRDRHRRSWGIPTMHGRLEG